jgi:hypothetical protein
MPHIEKSSEYLEGLHSPVRLGDEDFVVPRPPFREHLPEIHLRVGSKYPERWKVIWHIDADGRQVYPPLPLVGRDAPCP